MFISTTLQCNICLDRERPNLAVVKCLLAVNSDAVKTSCADEGYLPIHRFVNREVVDKEILKFLILS